MEKELGSKVWEIRGVRAELDQVTIDINPAFHQSAYHRSPLAPHRCCMYRFPRCYSDHARPWSLNPLPPMIRRSRSPRRYRRGTPVRFTRRASDVACCRQQGTLPTLCVRSSSPPRRPRHTGSSGGWRGCSPWIARSGGHDHLKLLFKLRTDCTSTPIGPTWMVKERIRRTKMQQEPKLYACWQPISVNL